MSALASLAAYGDDDDDAGEAPSAPAVASSSSPKPHDASSAADTAAHTSAESHSAPSPPAPSQQSQAADAGAHERSRSLPSPVLQPSRTPSSFTSSISHLLPALPPPVTTSNPAIEAKIQNFFAALQRGHSVSEQLRSSKRFNNPDILEKLVAFYELDEIGSNYAPEVFDPRAPYLKEDYKALADRQAAGHTPAPRTGVDFVASSAEKIEERPDKDKDGSSKAASDAKPPAPAADKGAKRSKWDVTEDDVPAAKAAKPAAPTAPKAAPVGGEMSAYRQFLEKRKTDGK